MKGDEFDPKGLIFEAYRIDGITKSECRTIFLDWALSIPIVADQKSMIQILLDRYGADGHPMSEVLNEGLASICLLYTSPSPRDLSTSRMPSSA